MNRVILSVLLTLVFFVALSQSPMVQAQGTGKPPEVVDDCTTACHSCKTACQKALTYCLNKGGKHKDPEHIKTLQDCIASCKNSEDFMSRGSELASKVCNVCAEACRRCAESCQKLGDKALQSCIDECQKCSTVCDKMAG